jgi:hypothetical protein
MRAPGFQVSGPPPGIGPGIRGCPRGEQVQVQERESALAGLLGVP